MSQPLGQHFLKNETAIERIIEALDIHSDEIIIEIGPGAGALTLPLVELCTEKNAKLLAIEKDPELVSQLTSWSTAQKKQLEIITGDALMELPKLVASLAGKPYKLVGNIPYYITGALLRTIGELGAQQGGASAPRQHPDLLGAHKPEKTVLMIQKEVAQRLCAGVGRMNLLAAATQLWAETKLLFTLPPSDFDPPPEVYSAVITLTPKKNQLHGEQAAAYYRALHVIFKQPRKTLLNNLAEVLGREESLILLQKMNLDERVRPQDLTLGQLEKMSTALNLPE